MSAKIDDSGSSIVEERWFLEVVVNLAEASWVRGEKPMIIKLVVVCGRVHAATDEWQTFE